MQLPLYLLIDSHWFLTFLSSCEHTHKECVWNRDGRWGYANARSWIDDSTHHLSWKSKSESVPSSLLLSLHLRGRQPSLTTKHQPEGPGLPGDIIVFGRGRESNPFNMFNPSKNCKLKPNINILQRVIANSNFKHTNCKIWRVYDQWRALGIQGCTHKRNARCIQPKNGETARS